MKMKTLILGGIAAAAVAAVGVATYHHSTVDDGKSAGKRAKRAFSHERGPSLFEIADRMPFNRATDEDVKRGIALLHEAGLGHLVDEKVWPVEKKTT